LMSLQELLNKADEPTRVPLKLWSMRRIDVRTDGSRKDGGGFESVSGFGCAYDTRNG
jgi:hypothetical protein